jgi:membrane protein
VAVLQSTAKRFNEHRCLSEARSLSFVTLLSLVPFLTVILVIVSRLPFYPSLKEKLLFGISSSFLPEKSTQVTEYIHLIFTQGRSVGVIGTLFSVVLAFSLLLAFIRSVNAIWDTKRSGHLLLSFIKFLVIIVAGPVLVVITFMLQNYVSIQKLVQWIFKFISSSRAVGFPSIGFGFTKVFSLLVNWGMLAFLYGFIPHTKMKPGLCFISGVCAGTLWWLMRFGLNVYVKLIPQMNLLYGSLAFIPIFLIWVYVSWIIVLFGVELNYTLHSERK